MIMRASSILRHLLFGVFCLAACGGETQEPVFTQDIQDFEIASGNAAVLSPPDCPPPGYRYKRATRELSALKCDRPERVRLLNASEAKTMEDLLATIKVVKLEECVCCDGTDTVLRTDRAAYAAVGICPGTLVATNVGRLYSFVVDLMR